MPRIVTLSGGSPWGFRLVGGCDFHANLAISKVTPGGKADIAGLKPGDVIAAINGHDASQLSHLDAQNYVKSSTSNLALKVESSNEQRTSSNPPESKSGNSNFVTKPTYKSTATVPTKTWQPIRPKPTPIPSNNDSLPPPPPVTTINQNQFINARDDFPTPPTVTPVTSHQSSSAQELICEGCKQLIRGPYLTAQGKNWHPDEFVCSSANCRRPLQNCGFIEEKGERYCSECYEKYFAHACGKCHKKIVGEVMHALNQTWHVSCFVCTACNQAFRDGVFHLEHDKPYCVSDYNLLFGTMCKGCGYPIEAGDHYVEAIKAQWHETCFTCAVNSLYNTVCS
ncbi:unnamed protein product [Clavelina lepadiformis]|uniref:PDZ and LIM domain protein Zasp n=1 Tax=Clavelina lepadiformis TaxID=159417 RepID=A0ABP0F6R0_CLALP